MSGTTMIICGDCGEHRKRYAHGKCQACYMKEHNGRYYQKHRDKWVKQREYDPQYYDSHKKEKSEYSRRYRGINPDVGRIRTSRYRAKKKDLSCTLTPGQGKEILARGICEYCGDVEGPFHLEHQVPVSQGGGFTEENIVCACARCNYRKGTKSVEEFLSELADNVVEVCIAESELEKSPG